MNRSYDIVVAGLGPGGAMAAVELARAGAKVLVLDGKPGKAKPCGGCLSRRWEWLFKDLHLPEELWRHPVDRLWLAAPGQPAAYWRTREPSAYLVERSKFDRALAEAALQAGAQVVRARALDVSQDNGAWLIRSSAGLHQAGWVIGAAGAGGAWAAAL